MTKFEKQRNFKTGFYQIRSYFVQLYCCEHGLWNDDGKCRLSLVCLTFYKPYSLYRSVSVCSDTFLSSGASIATIAVTAFLMNSRQAFYSLSFIQTFRKTGHKKLYMIHTMTDETYAVNCTLQDNENNRKIMFWVAFFSRCYWMTGAVLGGIIGQLIPFDLNGIDFCMTALFVIIFIDQWEKSDSHFPAIVGFGSAVVCLGLFGQQAFMLPALILVSGILLFHNSRKEPKNEC